MDLTERHVFTVDDVATGFELGEYDGFGGEEVRDLLEAGVPIVAFGAAYVPSEGRGIVLAWQHANAAREVS